MPWPMDRRRRAARQQPRPRRRSARGIPMPCPRAAGSSKEAKQATRKHTKEGVAYITSYVTPFSVLSTSTLPVLYPSSTLPSYSTYPGRLLRLHTRCILFSSYGSLATQL